jgi:hypothetical protein
VVYPDPLLPQVLTAATFWTEIPDAARWADQHHYLTGPALTSAMAADQVPWDSSVQALVPFPSVLDMMASAMPWTQEIGSAFLAEPNNVMDAVQRMRQSAVQYGYLRSGSQVIVRTGPYIEIVPVNPSYIVVPYYDPLIVFAAPRPGFFVGGGIRDSLVQCTDVRRSAREGSAQEGRVAGITRSWFLLNSCVRALKYAP